MLQTKISTLLKEIQSGELEWAYCHVTYKAVEWTISGFVDEGINLLELLWSFGIEHSRNVWLDDEGLQIMWQVAGKKPSNIPFQFKDVEDIEKENWYRMFYPAWYEPYMQKVIEKPVEQLEGQELYVRAILEVYNKISSIDNILRLFDKCIESGQDYATRPAFYLAAKAGFEKKADKYLSVFGKEYLNHPTSYTLSELMRDRSAATILLRGSLAPVFEITKEHCLTETKQIKEALEQRISQGRSLVYGNLSWKELLKEMSVLAVEQNTYEFTEEQREKKWLGYKGANEEQIKDAEKRLGVLLPNDYKEFLKVSNGFDCLSNINLTIMPVEKIDYLRTLDAQLVNIWTSDPDRNEFNHQFSSSILIGGYQEEQQLLLVPVSNDEWECWFFAVWSPGETKYPNFRFYMEEVMTRLKEDFFNS
jgi:hypothetical protein